MQAVTGMVGYNDLHGAVTRLWSSPVCCISDRLAGCNTRETSLYQAGIPCTGYYDTNTSAEGTCQENVLNTSWALVLRVIQPKHRHQVIRSVLFKTTTTK